MSAAESVRESASNSVLQHCLNAPSPTGGNENGPEDPAHAQVQPQAGGMPRTAPMTGQQYGMDPNQLAYQTYLQQQGGQYPMPPQGRMPAHGGAHHQ
jgi:pheromone receptor transcription factor